MAPNPTPSSPDNSRRNARIGVVLLSVALVSMFLPYGQGNLLTLVLILPGADFVRRAKKSETKTGMIRAGTILRWAAGLVWLFWFLIVFLGAGFLGFEGAREKALEGTMNVESP